MNLDADLRQTLEDLLQTKIVETQSISGGCIANACRISDASGKYYFLKSGRHLTDAFRAEANGLRELAKANAIRVPAVLHSGDGFLLLEYIGPGSVSGDFFERFGRQFADLHRFTSEQFGFYENNFIGSTPQINTFSNNWIEFYYQHRLMYQYRLAEGSGKISSRLRKGFLQMESIVTRRFSGSEEAPSLLHGDLWSGNFMADQSGNPCIIDPAVYYGHREADLAMTKLFGGFPAAFYDAYREAWPLPPGYADREDLYKLYHVMNHLNLFGSGYLGQAEAIVGQY